jgi:hypothetical protein
LTHQIINEGSSFKAFKKKNTTFCYEKTQNKTGKLYFMKFPPNKYLNQFEKLLEINKKYVLEQFCGLLCQEGGTVERWYMYVE